jgi:hypothetical protein
MQQIAIKYKIGTKGVVVVVVVAPPAISLHVLVGGRAMAHDATAHPWHLCA